MDPSRPTSESSVSVSQIAAAGFGSGARRVTSESSVSVSQIAAAGTAGGESALSKIPSRRGYFRWVICTLLLLGTTKNYMDRNVLGVLRVTLQHDLGWNEID